MYIPRTWWIPAVEFIQKRSEHVFIITHGPTIKKGHQREKFGSSGDE